MGRSFCAALGLNGNRTGRALALLLASLVAACSERPIESPQFRAELPREAVPLVGAASPSAATAPALVPKPAKAVNVLALSGGGADGAFGAGVLVGWSETGKRPEFDIITGVSTGSFMAALVFAGPKYDSTLKKIYTTYSNSDIYEDKGAAGLVTESMLDDAPLRKLIEKIVTKSFVAEVAAEHAKGRRLYVATTNLDSGELVVWDMGAIAAGNRADPILMFQKVLRASAAVPGFFAPVYIKPQKGVELRQAHVDGGVKSPMLVKSFMLETPARERNLYVIVNGSLARLNASAPVKASVTEIGKKSIAELLRSLTDASLYQAYAAARNSGTNFRVLAIPDAVPASVNALDFNKPVMQRLYSVGHELGRQADPWAREPPRLDTYEKIAAPASPLAKPPSEAIEPVAGAKPIKTATKPRSTDWQNMAEQGP